MMRAFPPEWIVFGERRVIEVPARYHSRLIGQLIFAFSTMFTIFLFFINNNNQNYIFGCIVALLTGFLFALGWCVYFPYRTLVLSKHKLDVLYMIVHIFIEYLFIFGLISFPFFGFYSICCAIGATLLHFLDINLYKINNYYRYNQSFLQRNQPVVPPIREPNANIQLETLREVLFGTQKAVSWQNPYYRRWQGLAIILFGLLILMATCFISWGLRFSEIALINKLVLCFLGGSVIVTAQIFLIKDLACPIRNDRIDYFYFVFYSLIAFFAYFVLFYFLHWKATLIEVLSFAASASAGSAIGNFVIGCKVYSRWRKQMRAPDSSGNETTCRDSHNTL